MTGALEVQHLHPSDRAWSQQFFPSVGEMIRSRFPTVLRPLTVHPAHLAVDASANAAAWAAGGAAWATAPPSASVVDEEKLDRLAARVAHHFIDAQEPWWQSGVRRAWQRFPTATGVIFVALALVSTLYTPSLIVQSMPDDAFVSKIIKGICQQLLDATLPVRVWLGVGTYAAVG